MRHHCLLVFTGESTFRGFLGGAGFRPSTVCSTCIGNRLVAAHQVLNVFIIGRLLVSLHASKYLGPLTDHGSSMFIDLLCCPEAVHPGWGLCL